MNGDPTKPGGGVDLSGAREFARRQALAAMQSQMSQANSLQVAALCVQISTNRDKMLGEHGSEVAADIVDRADEILFGFLQGLRTLEPAEGEGQTP